MGTSVDARLALLSGLIDHAPLFPPASLSLAEAVEEDRRARESSAAFMLGRFVCPASRLAELPRDDRSISLVLDDEPRADERVEAVEVRFRDDLASFEGGAAEIYVEVPIDADLETRLDALARHDLRAKVRCGGASVPGEDELARFLHGCGERQLAFKATAGLHHALRTDGEHGCLNLLAAVVFGDAAEALSEKRPDAFTLDRDGFGWRGRIVGAGEISRARNAGLHSIGSCSFFEPVDELGALGMLPL